VRLMIVILVALLGSSCASVLVPMPEWNGEWIKPLSDPCKRENACVCLTIDDWVSFDETYVEGCIGWR